MMFGMFAGSTGIGPFISTKSFDLYHSYTPAFRLYEAITVIAIAILALLGLYTFPARDRRAPAAREQKAAV